MEKAARLRTPAQPLPSAAAAGSGPMPQRVAGVEHLLPLRFAFQDSDNLYLLSDFCAGGDLLGLLEKFDVFPEVPLFSPL
jgi:hypothetical protein